MLEGRPVPTSEGRKDGHRGTKKPCVFHQPLRACNATAQEWSMILPSKDSAIKDWGNDVFNVFCLMRLSRQGLFFFFTVSMKMTKHLKSLMFKNSKPQFPGKLSFFFFLTMWIGWVITFDTIMDPNSITGQSFPE